MFFIVFSVVYILAHLYILYRIVYDFSLKKLPLILTIIVFISLALLSKYSHQLSMSVQLPYVFTKLFIDFGYIWHGAISITFTVFLISHILFIFKRNKSFKLYTTFTALVLSVILITYSIINASGDPVVKNISIYVPKLVTDKLTIVELADMHIDRHTHYNEIQKIVDITNSLNADIVTVVGDLVDMDISQKYKNYGLDRLKSKYGIFAVSGNHEYYRGIDKFEFLCAALGITLLNNSNVLVDNQVCVAGISDLKASKRFNYEQADIQKALQGVDYSKPVIFLSHQPNIFEEVSKYPITLQLSAHTHAGQIPPFDLVEFFLYKYFFGLYHENNSYIYVTSGTRFWGPPMRLFSKCEIVKITLYKDKNRL